ncbi:hypothetical protein D1815_11315 [Aquimarina sp. AD1]|uniref:hypothetical protein n=1 Tax=Aquimarina sp. (strain AD1) TaxID=1714848 RepID=UPI000E5093AE|nr:hypothetical protein [Aquimarina sp. AD1]AXT56315.1 hypothetical protein D1815_11315 [Aquimarina sp. AD1]RKN29906.1 hypothetical protein D7035_06595 [Aquimarina sp. AD1]
MLKGSYTYNHKLLFSWFITLLLFLGIGGYTNYTQPISYENTIELVISSKENNLKTTSYNKVIKSDQKFRYYNSDLQFLVRFHNSIHIVKGKEFNNTISLTLKHKIFFPKNTNYTSEENSFHIG